MENQRYMQEGVDVKRVFLLIKNKLWLLAVAVAAGALLGCGIYLLTMLVFAPEREYQAVSKVYLTFACDPEDYNELSYNGYTWNDLMATDPILNFTMDRLPSTVDRETVIGATKAEILSDIRLLTITITTPQPELTAQIMGATQESLVHLGETDPLFKNIEIYSTTEPALTVWDNRTVNAALTGGVIALVGVLLGIAFCYIMDDSVYVASDVEKRYQIPVLGIFTVNEPGTFQSYRNEFFANYTYLCKGIEKIALVSVDCAEDTEKADQLIDKMISAEKPIEESLFLPMAMPEEVPDVYEDIRNTDGVILTVRFGRRNGKRLERTLGNMRKQDCRVLGAVIVEADEKFLKAYYRGEKLEKH